MQQRTDEAARAEGIDVAGGPHVAHACVSGENRVLCGRLVEEVGSVLGVDRTHLLDVARVGADGSVHDLRVLLDLGLQEGVGTVCAQVGEECFDEGLDLRVDREADVRAAAQLLGVRVHLDGRCGRQELVVGEIGAQQDQHVGVVHALSCCAVAQQARHTHVEGVVVLDEVLAAQRVADRCLECIRQGDNLVMGAFDAGAGENGDLVGLVEEGCGLFNVGGIGSQCRGARGRVGGNVLNGLEVRDVAGQGDDRDAAQADRVADRRVHRARRLRRGGNELVVDRAFLENSVRVGLLEVRRADLHARDVRGNGEDGRTRAVRVVQAVDEVQVARAARARAHGELACQLSFGRRCERRRFLVAHVDPVDAALL